MWSDLARKHWCSPHYSPGRTLEVEIIVVHFISLPPGEFSTGHPLNFFLGRLDPRAHPYFFEIAGLRVSPHFFIERNGIVHQLVDTDDRAWHAGESSFQGRADCNEFSIGIELEGDERHPFTDQQYASLEGLCRQLMFRYPRITARRIVGHRDVAPHRKIDPGPFFQWDRLRRAVERKGIKGGP